MDVGGLMMTTENKKLLTHQEIVNKIAKLELIQENNIKIISEFKERITKVNDNITDQEIQQCRENGIDISFIRNIDSERLKTDRNYLLETKEIFNKSSLNYREVLTDLFEDAKI